MISGVVEGFQGVVTFTMPEKLIEHPRKFLADYSLHDVRVDHLAFDIEGERLVMTLEDLHVNFRNPTLSDFPRFSEERRCQLIFEGVQSFLCDVSTQEGVRISSVRSEATSSEFRIEFDLNLGGGEMTKGRNSLVFVFSRLLLNEAS